jgi:hypothetical protein
MAKMNYPMPRLSTLAVVSLVAIGLFLIAISVPPLYDVIWGEAPWSFWEPTTLANGLLYLATAVLVATALARFGVGMAMVLGMLGFTVAFGFMLSRFAPGIVDDRMAAETIVLGLLAGAHAVVVVGVLSGAKRWNLIAELSPRRAAAAALLAGIGFALALGSFGGDYARTLAPISMPRMYQAVGYTIAIPHFVAFAAIALNGRFARIGSVALIVAGMVLAVQVLVALVGPRSGFDNLSTREYIVVSMFLWTFLLVAWAVAGLLLLGPGRVSMRRTVAKPVASAQTWNMRPHRRGSRAVPISER